MTESVTVPDADALPQSLGVAVASAVADAQNDARADDVDDTEAVPQAEGDIPPLAVDPIERVDAADGDAAPLAVGEEVCGTLAVARAVRETLTEDDALSLGV